VIYIVEETLDSSRLRRNGDGRWGVRKVVGFASDIPAGAFFCMGGGSELGFFSYILKLVLPVS
jgi:hypothetical protein